MQLAVMQPYFFPYVGYFSLIESVEHFMFFDDVQYTKKSWMSRNRLLNIAKGEPFYIRPELQKTEYQALLPSVKLSASDQWKLVLMEQLKGYKNKAPFYTETIPLVESILEKSYEMLADFNIESTIEISKWMGISPKFDRFTDYNFWFDSKPGLGDWGREVSKAVGASSYINSPGGETFIFPEGFTECNIKLGFIQPKLEEYDQGESSFVPGLSILDVLLFNGREKAIEMVRNYTVKWKN